MKHFKMLYFLLMLTIISVVILNAQAPDTLWTKTYGGELDDNGQSVQQTSDGGYIISGYKEIYSPNYTDIYLVKTDANGDTLWTKAYDRDDCDKSRSVQQTSDDGYIIAGWTGPWGTYCDVFLIKTDAMGETLWTRTYGGSNDDWASEVKQTFDGGYIIAGVTESFGGGYYQNIYLIKTDANGDTTWTRTHGGTEGTDWAYSVQQTADSGYIIVGWTDTFGAGCMDVFLVKTDSLGYEVWKRTYGGISNDIGFSVQQTSDGGYIITGFTTLRDTVHYFYQDVYLIKTNEYGDTVWTKIYGGADHDNGLSVLQTSDGGYIIAGETLSFGPGADDVYLLRTNQNGDTIWTQTYGGPLGEFATEIQKTTDGGYIVVGCTSSFGAGYLDIYLIKIKSDLGVEEQTDPSQKTKDLRFIASPNPFSTVTNVHLLGTSDKGKVSLQVYDVGGRLIKSIPPSTNQFTLGADLSTGIYFLKADGVCVEKVVKVK